MVQALERAAVARVSLVADLIECGSSGTLFDAFNRRRWNLRNGLLAPLLFAEAAQVDLRIVGRTLLHAALVGLAAGLVGAGFFAGVEYTQNLLMEGLAGYVPLRASGERFAAAVHPSTFKPWLLALLLVAILSVLWRLPSTRRRPSGSDRDPRTA